MDWTERNGRRGGETGTTTGDTERKRLLYRRDGSSALFGPGPAARGSWLGMAGKEEEGRSADLEMAPCVF